MSNDQWTVKEDGNRRVYVNSDGACQIAEGYWLPGIYADEAAAWTAFDVDDQTLAKATHHTVRGTGDAYRPMTLDEVRTLLAGAH